MEKKIGLINFFFIILVFILVDLDHFFLTEKIGFRRIPDPGTLIFQLFHTIEFYSSKEYMTFFNKAKLKYIMNKNIMFPLKVHIGEKQLL